MLFYMLAARAFPDRWASVFSEEISVVAAQDTVAPGPPTGLSVETKLQGVVVSWTNPTINEDDSDCNDLAWVRVYRSTSEGIDKDDAGTYESKVLVAGESYTYEAEASYGAGRYYQCVLTATGAIQGVSVSNRGFRGRTLIEQFFVVTAIDRSGNESIISGEASATPTASSALDIDRYLEIRLLEKDTDHAAETDIGGDFRFPEAMTIVEVGMYFDTAGSGSVTTLDIHESGVTILSTKITIDDGEKTSKTADAQPAISDSAYAADAILTFDFDGVSSGTAGKGLTIWMKVKV